MFEYIFIIIVIFIQRGINYFFPNTFDKYFHPEKPLDSLALLNFLVLFTLGYNYPAYLKFLLTTSLLLDSVFYIFEKKNYNITSEHFIMYSISGMLGTIFGHSYRTNSFI